MTCDELVNFYQIEMNEGESWYKGVYEYGERLYEFGKYTDFDLSNCYLIFNIFIVNTYKFNFHFVFHLV